MPGLQIFDGSSWRAIGVQDSYWDVMTATSGGSSVSLSWPNAGNSPVSYEVDIDGTVTNVGNVTSYVPPGLSVGNSYNFKVRPVFSDGSTGGWSLFKTGGPDGFNRASGGTESTVSNYNGTSQTWKIHTFNSNGNFSVTDSPGINSFKVLVVAGGNGANYYVGTYANGGQVVEQTTNLSVGTYSVVRGSGGSGGQNNAQAGSPSSLGSITATAGGSTAQVQSNISGTSTGYGGSGNYSAAPGRGGIGAANSGTSGTAGIVIVAYRIA